MAIEVYGSTITTATRRVLACLYEKELEFNFVPIDVRARDHKREPFLSRNPFGLVPAFEDGDLKLFESRAINQYIAHNYADKGNQLLLKDPKKMAILFLWLEVEAQQFQPAAGKLTWELVMIPKFGRTTNEAIVEDNEVKLAKVLDVYEAHLAQSKYLAGDCFTLADLNHLPQISSLMHTKVKKLFDSRPHVSAWCADILARPAWLKVVALQDSNDASVYHFVSKLSI